MSEFQDIEPDFTEATVTDAVIDTTQFEQALADYQRAGAYLLEQNKVTPPHGNFRPITPTSPEYVFNTEQLLFHAARDAGIDAHMSIVPSGLPFLDTIFGQTMEEYAIGTIDDKDTGLLLSLLISDVPSPNPYLLALDRTSTWSRIRNLTLEQRLESDGMKTAEARRLKAGLDITAIVLGIVDDVHLGRYEPGTTLNHMQKEEIQAFNEMYAEGHRPLSVEALQGVAARAVQWALKEQS